MSTYEETPKPRSLWCYLSRIVVPIIAVILLFALIENAGSNQAKIDSAVRSFIEGDYVQVRQDLNACGWFWAWGKKTILDQLLAKERDLLNDADDLAEHNKYEKAIATVEKAAIASGEASKYNSLIATLKTKQSEYSKKQEIEHQALVLREQTIKLLDKQDDVIKKFASDLWIKAKTLTDAGSRDFDQQKFVDAQNKWNAAENILLEAGNTATHKKQQYDSALLAKSQCQIGAQVTHKLISYSKGSAKSISKHADDVNSAATNCFANNDFEKAFTDWKISAGEYRKAIFAIAQENDSVHDQNIALSILQDLLKIDPNNINAKQLHDKIALYYLQDESWWVEQAMSAAQKVSCGIRASIFRDMARSEVNSVNPNIAKVLSGSQSLIENISDTLTKAQAYCDFAELRIDANDVPIGIDALKNAKMAAQIIYEDDDKFKTKIRILDLYIRAGRSVEAKRIADGLDSYYKTKAYVEIVKTQAEVGDVHGAESSLALLRKQDNSEIENAQLPLIRAYSKRGDVAKARAMADRLESQKYPAYIAITREQLVKGNKSSARSLLQYLETLMVKDEGDYVLSSQDKALYLDIITLYSEIGNIERAESLVSKLDSFGNEDKKELAIQAIKRAKDPNTVKQNNAVTNSVSTRYSQMVHFRSAAIEQCKQKQLKEVLRWTESLGDQDRAYAMIGVAESLLKRKP
jgi:hypothetical protein